jgi:DNA mismatch repair ATPase MutS
MCVFNNYIRLQEELKELQKEIIVVTKNYNNELKLFQKENIIDSHHAEKIKQKYDALQMANEQISSKQNDIGQAEQEIQGYLTATNGMAIRYMHQNQGIDQPMIFELETNSYGEPKIRMGRED